MVIRSKHPSMNRLTTGFEGYSATQALSMKRSQLNANFTPFRAMRSCLIVALSLTTIQISSIKPITPSLRVSVQYTGKVIPV